MIEFVAGLLVGSIIVQLIIFKFYNLSRKLPYSWRCEVPDCNFGIKTNNEDQRILMSIIDDHKARHNFREV